MAHLSKLESSIGILGIILSSVIFTQLATTLFNSNPHSFTFIFFGLLFLIASSQKPLVLFQIVRSLRGFKAITDETVVRVSLFLLGGLLLLIGLVGAIASHFSELQN